MWILLDISIRAVKLIVIANFYYDTSGLSVLKVVFSTLTCLQSSRKEGIFGDN